MSAFIRDSLVEDYHCDPSKIAIVGAAPNLPPPAALPDNAGYSNRTILFVGIDWERKGGPLLVEAFRKVLENLPDARLIIAGSSPAIDLPNVEIAGPRPACRKSAGCSFAVPYWPSPPCASPRASTPSRPSCTASPWSPATSAPSRRWSKTAKPAASSPPGDAAALAAALIELLSNPALCRRYGEAGRESAMARYSSGAVSGRVGEAIRPALGVVPRS